MCKCALLSFDVFLVYVIKKLLLLHTKCEIYITYYIVDKITLADYIMTSSTQHFYLVLIRTTYLDGITEIGKLTYSFVIKTKHLHYYKNYRCNDTLD